jgi:hypothetical protein
MLQMGEDRERDEDGDREKIHYIYSSPDRDQRQRSMLCKFWGIFRSEEKRVKAPDACKIYTYCT